MDDVSASSAEDQDRRQKLIQHGRHGLTLRDSLAVCIRHFGEINQVDIIERFDPGQSVVRPRLMRNDDITDALNFGRRHPAQCLTSLCA
jgi:hypothetical protein